MLIEVQTRPQEVRLTRGEKVEAFEHLQIIPSWKEYKYQEEERHQSLDQLWEEILTIESTSRHLRKHIEEEIDCSRRI